MPGLRRGPSTLTQKDFRMSNTSSAPHPSETANQQLLMQLQDAYAEITRLRESLAESQQELASVQQTLQTLELAVRGSNDGLWNWNVRTNEAYISPRWKEILGYEDHELANHADTHASVLHPDDAGRAHAAVMANFERGEPYAVEVRMRHKDGSYRWVYTRGETMRDQDGKPIFMAGALTDITDRKRAEDALVRVRVQDEIIEAQNVILSELSTPVIPLTDKTMVMPLIGTVDSQRAQQAIETLLQSIVAHRASMVILDITGVRVVDTQIANVFIQAARSARLLGAQVILTGIRPEVAQTIVSLGIDLEGLITYSSLQQGISQALRN